MALGHKLASDYPRQGPVKFGGVPGTYSKAAATPLPAGHDEKSFAALLKEKGLTDVLVPVKNAPKPEGQLDKATPPPEEGK